MMQITVETVDQNVITCQTTETPFFATKASVTSPAEMDTPRILTRNHHSIILALRPQEVPATTRMAARTYTHRVLVHLHQMLLKINVVQIL